jgi:hypothetical protein
MSTAPRSHNVYSLEQAAGSAPTLAALRQRIRESSECLELVRHLIPATLHRQVQAGPLNEGEWCLLVSSASASTKLRHLLPVIQKQLADSGQQVTSVRLKIQTLRA